MTGSSSIRRNLLFVQPRLDTSGGGNGVAGWMLEALKRDYALTLLTLAPVDFAGFNRYFGTSLQHDDLAAVIVAPRWLREIARLDPDPDSLQPISLLMRFCKMIRHRFDLCLGAYDEVDFGAPGIQYVHYPWLARHYLREHAVEGGRLRLPAAYRPWRLLSGFSFAAMAQNLTLTNSEWTAGEIRRVYGVEAQVVYPPVCLDGPSIPWEARENGFVCIGRFDRNKRFEHIIEIVGRLRATVPDTHLHIVGTQLPNQPGSMAYYRRIVRLIAANADWVELHETISRCELGRLLAQHRYGLHAMLAEHFGTAVAEMVSAGCLVFAPNNGGQVEIVGRDEHLLFGSTAEAVAKINRIVSDPDEQVRLRQHLAVQAERFTAARFVGQIRQIVAAFLS